MSGSRNEVGAVERALPWDRSLAPFDAALMEDAADIRFFGKPALLINREEWIHETLVEKAAAFRKGPLLSVNAKPLVGDGMLSGPNHLNRRHRRLIAPAFAHRKIADYSPVIARYAAMRMAGWQEEATVDLPAEMTAIALGVIGELLLSADLLGDSENVGEAITVLMRFAIDEMAAPWQAVRAVPRALSALLFLNRTIHGEIAERRRRGDEDGAAEVDLLALLLFARDPDTGGPYMTDRLIRDEAMTLFLAGLETVAMGLTWATYLLAEHPDAAAQARAEGDAALGVRRPTAADLQRLPYLACVVKEALRLYPPAYIVARQALESVEIGPRRLRRGDVVFVSPYVQHHRPDHFAEPERFDPGRWADPDAERRLPGRFAYMPFGSGPRVCVGGHFALMEMQLVLAMILQRFHLRPVAGRTAPEPEPLFSLRPRGGLPILVERRRDAVE